MSGVGSRYGTKLYIRKKAKTSKNTKAACSEQIPGHPWQHNQRSLRLRIVSIRLRCFWRELRLEISDLTRDIVDRSDWLAPFGFLEEDDPIGIAP